MKRLLSRIFLLVMFFGINVEAQSLNPGDGLRLVFYNISDSLSGQYNIQENGYVSLPYLGEIKVANRNIDSIKQEIHNKYSNIYRNPELTILPVVRVNIFGEVFKPGYYYATGTDKLTDLIAMAGGPTPDAKVSNITLTRNGKEISIDGEKIIESGNKDNDIGLQSGDQVYVPRKWFSGANQAILIAALSTLTALIVAIIYTSKK